MMFEQKEHILDDMCCMANKHDWVHPPLRRVCKRCYKEQWRYVENGACVYMDIPQNEWEGLDGYIWREDKPYAVSREEYERRGEAAFRW